MTKEKNIENNDIVETTAKTIIDYNIDTIIDFSEVGFDSFFDDSLFKELPLVKTIYGVAKTGFAIKEKYMLKKVLLFINQLNNNSISNKNYIKYKESLNKNEKIVLKELEYVLIIIDRYIELNKNVILANLYFNYIDKKIDWIQFQELSIIVDNIFLSDLKELKRIYDKKFITMNQIENQISFRRLKTQNLVEDIQNVSRSSDGRIFHYYNKNDYKISILGELLYKYGMNRGI